MPVQRPFACSALSGVSWVPILVTGSRQSPHPEIYGLKPALCHSLERYSQVGSSDTQMG